MNLLGMFAKYWTPGQVKTRLAAELGDAAASRLYRLCLQTLLERFQDVGERRLLAFSPDSRRVEFEQLAAGRWELTPQTGGDLGARMQDFFAAALSGPVQRVVLVGSDSPTLPRELVQQAFERLREVDVVLGPASDGGYYLVGARKRVPPIFAGIAWSTPQVWQQTVERLSAAGISFAALPEWNDVDTLADLLALERQLTETLADEPAFDALREAVRLALRDARRLSGDG